MLDGVNHLVHPQTMFAEIVYSAEVPRGSDDLYVVAAAQYDYRNNRAFAFQLAESLKAFERWQVQIEQNQGELRFGQPMQSASQCVTMLDLEASSFKLSREEHRVRGFVFYEQHSLAHDSCLSSLCPSIRRQSGKHRH